MACQARIHSAAQVSGTGAFQVARFALLLRMGMLASIACAVVAGQGRGLFAERVDSGSRAPAGTDEMALRGRRVDIDFGKLLAVREALVREPVPSGDIRNGDQSEITLTLNLFADATYTGVFDETRPTSAGLLAVWDDQGSGFRHGEPCCQ